MKGLNMELPVLYCLLSGSALTDIYRHKILNRWLLAGVCMGLALSFFGEGQDPFYMKLLRASITLLCLIPVYALGGLGGGDIKLFAVTAMFLNKNELIAAVVVSFVIAAFMGILKIIKNKKPYQTINFAVPVLISVLLITKTSL
ncbi:A24 family peptidase [Butyrivibrio sp. AE3006]|jgi:Flp pilus assembly protein protease CpaA|uniref:A24 family peptidase n=1 Tax=Butyrivibrio sp. AE3006 TaxID=1280673 RepID=UPI00047A2FA7|nr:prepilin peptidase [Butyrivibrio sp. AE3006]